MNASAQLCHCNMWMDRRLYIPSNWVEVTVRPLYQGPNRQVLLRSQVFPTRRVTSYLAMSPNVETVRMMREELEASCVSAEPGHRVPGATAAASRRSSASGTTATHLKRSYLTASYVTSPSTTTATVTSATGARFPGDAPPANLIGLDADPNAMLEALYPTHNRYVRQQLPAVKAKSSGNPFAKLLQPSKSGRVTATTSIPQPNQKLEDGFLADAINRLCADPSDWRADCSGYPVFDPSSDEEVDEKFKFLMGPVRLAGGWGGGREGRRGEGRGGEGGGEHLVEGVVVRVQLNAQWMDGWTGRRVCGGNTPDVSSYISSGYVRSI